MKTYLLDFSYTGVKSNFGTIDSDMMLARVENYLSSSYKDRNLRLDHEYSRPDGSCYKSVATDIPSEEIRKITEEICEKCTFSSITFTLDETGEE